MAETKTPGQIAYEAYLRTWNIPGLRTWHEEPRGQQRAWEAAAQAVLDAYCPPRDGWWPEADERRAHRECWHVRHVTRLEDTAHA